MKPLSGLTEADAASRLQAEGHNELPQPDRRTPFSNAVIVVQETRTERVLQSLRNDPLAVDQTPQPTGR